MPSDQVLAAFTSLLDKTSLSSRDVRASLRKARDPRYWRELNPELTVSGQVQLNRIRHTSIDGEPSRSAVEHMETDGYFALDRFFSSALIRRLRTAVERVRDAGWPIVFSTVYDEFWLILRVPPLVRLLEKILGPGYLQIPHLWCHYVNPVSGASGWPPHVDGNAEKRISIWVPLSDATIDNGCIYLIPDGRISEDYSKRFRMRRRYSKADAALLLQSMRALPAPAGSILGWNFGIIHWGSTASDGREPRISVAYEFIGRDVAPEHDESPLLDAQSTIPSFQQRLEIIGRAVFDYRKFEPRMERYKELAVRLQSKV